MLRSQLIGTRRDPVRAACQPRATTDDSDQRAGDQCRDKADAVDSTRHIDLRFPQQRLEPGLSGRPAGAGASREGRCARAGARLGPKSRRWSRPASTRVAPAASVAQFDARARQPSTCTRCGCAVDPVVVACLRSQIRSRRRRKHRRNLPPPSAHGWSIGSALICRSCHKECMWRTMNAHLR